MDTPLVNAVKSNNLDLARELLLGGINVNEQGEFGFSALHHAFIKRNFEIVKMLVDHGADVNARIFRGGWTPLHYAVSLNNLEITEYLVLHGANINAKDDYGSTPLHDAVISNHFEIVKYLVLHGADVNAQNKFRSTPLRYAVQHYGKFETVKFLILHGAQNIPDNDGVTPMNLGLTSTNPEIRNYFTELRKQDRNREYKRTLTRGSALNPEVSSLANLPNDILELISEKASGLSFGTSEMRYLRKLIK